MSDAILGRRLRASGIWAATGRTLSGVLLLLLHALLARSLSGGDYGRFVLIESVAVLLSTVCLAGIPAVTLRMLRTRLTMGDEVAASQVVRSSFLVLATASLVTTGATVVVSFLLPQWLPHGLGRDWLLWFTAWAVLTAGLRLVSEIFRGYDRFSAAYCIGGQSGGLIVNACLLLFSFAAIATDRCSLRAILAIHVCVQFVFLVLGAGGLRISLRRTTKNGPATGAARATLTLLVVSAWPLLAQQLVSVGLPEAGKLLLGVYATPADAGVYNIALRLVLLAHVPLLVVNSAIQPFVTDLHTAGNQRQLMILTRGSATLAALPCLAVLCLFLVFPELILHYAFGPEFSAAAPALRILVLYSERNAS